MWVMIPLGAKAIGRAFGELAPMQRQGRPDLAQRSGSRIDPRHAQPVIPARSPTPNAGVPAVRPDVADPPELPLFRQPFTGASSLVTLTL